MLGEVKSTRTPTESTLARCCVLPH